MGRDNLFIRLLGDNWKFQSTRPVWGATRQRRVVIEVGIVSIHAPRVGRDINAPTLYLADSKVSIHAPRVGRDDASSCCLTVFAVFQSTRPVWGATDSCDCGGGGMEVSIHAPRVGRDAKKDENQERQIVSIHAPRVGRDMLLLRSYGPNSLVSIHAPRVGRDAKLGIIFAWPQKVSIHAPRVGRDLSLLKALSVLCVSIHAPRVGRD